MEESREAGIGANVGAAERVATAGFGAWMLAYGLRRRGVLGAGIAALGSYLVYRGATGRCGVYRTLGIDTARNYTGLHAEPSVVIDRPARELFRFWRNFRNLPRFMDHLESVTVQDDTHSHWVARAILGKTVEWDAEIINERPDELIVWRSLDGADVQSVGSVSFTPMDDGRSTLVKVVMQYDPPAGQFGAAAARLLGADPAVSLERDLQRLRELIDRIAKSEAVGRKRAKKDGHVGDRAPGALRIAPCGTSCRVRPSLYCLQRVFEHTQGGDRT